MLDIKKLNSFLPFLSAALVIAVIFSFADVSKVPEDSEIQTIKIDNISELPSISDLGEEFDITPILPGKGNTITISPTQNNAEVDVFAHKIIASDVNMRDESTISSKVITKLARDEKVKLINRTGDWSRVETSSGEVGWVNNDFVASKDFDTTKAVKKPIPLGQQVVNFSKKFIGVRYVWGGISPKGFDCSGLVKYVYSNFGISLDRVASDQAKQGKKITRNNLMPGDLVFFDTHGGHSYINHVGIYVGNGDFIQASSGYSNGHRIVISDLSSGFYANAYMTARRIIY